MTWKLGLYRGYPSSVYKQRTHVLGVLTRYVDVVHCDNVESHEEVLVGRSF